MEKITLSVKEVAALLGISTALVYNQAREGGIPHVKLGDRILFHRGVIEAWLKGE